MNFIKLLIKYIGFVFLICCLQQEKSFAQIGAYYIPASAIERFEKDFFESKKNNIESWVKSQQGEVITMNWTPSSNYYTIYKIYGLELWFASETYNDQSDIRQRLNYLKSELPISEEIRGDIEIYSINKSSVSTEHSRLVGGSFINIVNLLAQSSENPELSIGEEKSIREIAESFGAMRFDDKEQQILNKLRGQFSEEGEIKFEGDKVDYKTSKIGEKDGEKTSKVGNTKSGNGKKAWFPVSVSFSRWFATLTEILISVLDQAFCGGQCEQYLKKALALAYVIMPDVMDNIASTLAKLQHQLTPDNIDDALNKVTKIAELAYNLYQDFKKVQDLINNGNFQELINSTNLSEAANILDQHAEKYGLGFKDKLPGKVKEFFHYGDCIGLKGFNDNSLECFKGKIVNDFSNAAVKTIPGMDKIGFTPTDLSNLINGNKSLEQLGEEKAKDLICKSIPTNRYDNACYKFLNGKPLDAAIEIGREEFKRLSGIPFSISEIEDFFKALQNEDYIHAIKIVGHKLLNSEKYARYLEGYADIINNILNGKETNEAMALDILRIFLNIIYGNNPKVNTIFYVGENIIEDFATWRIETRVNEENQLTIKEANVIKDSQLPESILDSTIIRLEGYKTIIEDDNMLKSNLESLKKQKKEYQDNKISFNESSQFSDDQWIKWKEKISNKEGQDGYLELILPDFFNKNNYDVSRRVYFINGMLNSFEDAKNGAKEIANRIKQPVCFIYSRSLKDKKLPTLTPGNDALEAISIALHENTPYSGLILKQGIEIDLSYGKEVLVFAHSRGAAIAFNMSNQIANSISSFEKRTMKYKRLTIVTFGGYCPSRAKWSSKIKVINHINDGDPVPFLRGNRRDSEKHYERLERMIKEGGGYKNIHISISKHNLESYYKYVSQYRK